MGSINLINGGLDVQSIVDGLINLESEPIRRIQRQTAAIQSKVSAFQSLNTKLSSLLDKVNSILFKDETVPLNTPGNYEDRLGHSVFARRTVTSSDTNVITASASKGTAAGAYAITVSHLAQAKSMAADNFADIGTTKTGTGTLVFTVGTGTPVTVTIDSTNNTLEGVRKAINNAHAGVTATIINDGTATPYRLLITSDQTGIANDFAVQDNLVGGKALNLTQKLAAQDASMQVNGVAINKSTNTISDVIDGVSFTLHDTTTAAVTLTVGNDVEGMVSAVKDLVSAFNEVTSAINSQSRYNADTKTAGILAGDSTLRSIQGRIQGILSQSVSNEFTSYSILSQVGLQFNNDGTITLSESKLRDAISSDFTGVAALFLGDGAISDSRVTLNGQTQATQPGTYAIAVTLLAQQAAATGSRAVTNLAQAENLTITHGTSVTQVALLADDSLSTVLTKINGALSANGVAATAADDGTGRIRIRTNAYGGSQTISVVSDQPDAAGGTGFDTVPTTGTGIDIGGTINGHAATGSGLTLTGANGNPEEGLSITIAQTTVGSYGTVRVASGSTGVAGESPIINLRSVLKTITDPLTGPIHSSTDAFSANIRNLNDRISEIQDRLDVRRELLLREYARADQALRQMQVLQSALSNQLASLTKIG